MNILMVNFSVLMSYLDSNDFYLVSVPSIPLAWREK